MTVPAPLGLLAELTHRCPLQCPYCSNPIELDRKTGELHTETWKRVLSEASALGVLQVHLSGGEPTARPDLAEIVADFTAPLAERVQGYLDDPAELDRVLSRGATRAREVADALRATNWQLVAAATGLTDHRGPQADALTSKLRDALAFDEHAVRLADTLEQVETMATQLVTQTPAGDEPAPRPPDDPAVTVVDEGNQRGLDREQALDVLEKLRARIRADTLLDVTWRVTSTADGDDLDDDHEASRE